MNAIKSSIIAVLTALFSIPSLAQQYDSAPELAAHPFSGGQPIVFVAYKTAADERLLAGKISLSQLPGFGDVATPLFNTKNLRTSNLSMGVFRPGMFMVNDRASLTIYAPMQAVNGALSFARAVSGSALDASVNMWVQGLALVAKRQINTELAYSVKLDCDSKLDTAITYRLNPNTATGRSDVTASMRYSLKF